MSDLSSIYTQLIAEQSRNTKNKREMADAHHRERGHNPSCGDDITLQLKFNGDIIEDAAFVGHGCAISQASASIMIDLIKGRTKEEAMKLANIFLGMIKSEVTDESELDKLEDAIAFENISTMPARVKCAVLGWHTLEEAVSKKGD